MNDFTSSRKLLLSAQLAALLAIALMAFNIYSAASATSNLPVEDGWAVWNRAMDLNFHRLRWDQYLLRAHGAYAQSIVYVLAWLDFRYFDARHVLMQTVSYCAIVLFASWWAAGIWIWGKRRRQHSLVLIAAVVAIAALLTSLANAQLLLQPFQVGLSLSRLTYLGLLAFLVVALTEGRTALHFCTLAISCVAVTFNVDGYLFAWMFIVAHLLLSRHILRVIFSFLPLVAIIALQTVYTQPGGELIQSSALLHWAGGEALFKGIAAYFAAPMLPLRSTLGDTGLLLLGCALLCSTSVVSFYALRKTWRSNLSIFRRKHASAELDPNDVRDFEICAYAALVGLFLLLSAVAAGIYWIIRPPAPASPASYELVWSSARYAGYSSLSCVLLLGWLLTGARRRHGAAAAFSILLIVISTWPALHLATNYFGDDELNIAAAAISVGFSPLQEQAQAVWPRANTDWYWALNLPKTVAYLRIQHKSAWAELPELNALINGSLTRLPMALIRREPITAQSPAQKCQIFGNLPAQRQWSSNSKILPIVSADSRVMGFAVMKRTGAEAASRQLEGFMRCDIDFSALAPFYLVTQISSWVPESSQTLGQPAANITDPTWIKGVARNWSGFVMPLSPASQSYFPPGRMLRFADGQIRIVTRHEVIGPSLSVFVEGSPLDGNVVGFPEKIELLN